MRIKGFRRVIIVQLADQFIEEPHDGVEVEIFPAVSRERDLDGSR
jgi:hypothetical protein